MLLPFSRSLVYRNLLKNYRPVSNLSFISKLIEKAIANQLNSYINKEGLSNLNQSAYKILHSTTTALLKIQNDIAALMDSGKAVVLTLLDVFFFVQTLILNLVCTTHSPPTFEVQTLYPKVGCCLPMVGSLLTKAWPTVCTGFLCP